MSSNITLPVGSEQEGQRIDKFLQESLPGMSRSQAQKWIVQGLVRIGEKAAGKNDKLKSGMLVSVELPIPPEELDGEPDWEVKWILKLRSAADRQLCPVDLIQDIICTREETAALGRKCYLSSNPVKEPGPQFLFQKPNLDGNGGL